MLRGLDKSDLAVVAMKPANTASAPAAEWVVQGRGPTGTPTARDGLRAAIACPRGWNAYGRPQGKGSGTRSRRCCTTSQSMRSRPPSIPAAPQFFAISSSLTPLRGPRVVAHRGGVLLKRIV